MLLVFAKALRGHFISLGLMGLVLVGLGLLLPTTYEAFGGGRMGDFLGENMPRGIGAFLKADPGLLLRSGAQGYVGIGYRHPLFMIVVCAFAIASASGAIAREVERKTFLILLARPVQRYRIGLVRGGETLLGLVLLVAALLVGTFAGIGIAGLEGLDLGGFVLAGVNGLALFLAVAGYSYLLSALSSDGGRAIALATGLTVLFYLLDFFADLWGPLEFLGPVSVFHYYDPVTIAAQGSLLWRDLAVLLVVAAVTFSASLVVFQRRDIT